ncbi:MAG: hypothetical protein AAFN10_09075 [Bacteroidota bacterium]
MKKTIFYTALVIVAIAASLFIFKPKQQAALPAVAQVEIAKPELKEKVSMLSSDNSRGYYGDALEQAFEKAQLDDPALAAKVKEWTELRNELQGQISQYHEVIEYYQKYENAAQQKILQINDSTQRPALEAKIEALKQQPELKLAVARINVLSQHLGDVADYMTQLKIQSTVDYIKEAVTYAPDEASQFEALEAQVQGFLSD